MSQKLRQLIYYKDHVLVPLTQGAMAKIDVKDASLVAGDNWMLSHYGYAVRSRDGVFMHRLINQTESRLHTDHIDGDPLNNCRSNLRTATAQQNSQNMRSNKNSSSKFKGVGWDSANARWRAKIKVDGTTKCLGRYKLEETAARVYDSYAEFYFGEYAKLNFTTSTAVA